MVHFIRLVLVVILSSSCSVATVKDEQVSNIQHFTVTLEVFQNKMPLSGNESYVVINIVPKETEAKENYRVLSLTASGKNGNWQAKTFDLDEFQDKSGSSQNNARGFDSSIGEAYDFILIIQYQSGETETYEVRNVSPQVVY